MSDRFAAVAPVGGGPIRGGCSPSRPVPVMIHHGRRDELIELGYARLGRDLWIEANGCDKTDAAPALASCQTVPGCAAGAAVVYCEGDYAHSWPPGAAAQIWNFFEKHPRQE
jgi:poly(3-hydroxybutyrate) depolymerase